MNTNLPNDPNIVDNEQQVIVENNKLNLEEKLRIVKGLILLLLFSSVGKMNTIIYN
jgi:hypothetical protein